MKKKAFIPPILGLIFLIVYIIVANGVADFGYTIAGMNISIYVLAIILSIVDLAFYTLTWKKLINFLKIKLSFVKSFLYVLYAIYFDLMIPIETTSDITRSFLVCRFDKENRGKSIASVVFHRFLNTVILTVLLAVCVILSVGVASSLIAFSIGVIVIEVGFIVMIVLFVLHKTLAIKLSCKAAKIITKLTKHFGTYEEIEKKIEVAGVEFRESILQYMHSWRTLLTVTAFAGIALICHYAMIYLIFISIGYHITPLIAVFSTMIMSSISTIPLYIEFGVPELTMTGVYFWFGIPVTIIAAVTVLNRLITLWLRFGMGFVSYQIVELKNI